MELLYILLGGVLDRLRGGLLNFSTAPWALFLRGKFKSYNLPIPSALYGYLTAIVCNHPFDLYTIGIVIGFIIGERPGYGAVIGEIMGDVDPSRKPEWYQVFPFDNPWLAAILRGLIWGIPVYILTLLTIWQVAVAMAIAMPLSILLFKYIKFPKNAGNEWYRGFIFIAMLEGLCQAFPKNL